MMNILYIAYSCDPFQGSEDKIGWNVALESAKTNKVYVITKEEQRKSVEKYSENQKLENIKFYYVDIPKVYKKVFKGFLYSGRLNIWNRQVFPVAKKICDEKAIDIIHQITPIEFRAIGNYGKIDGVKFVCGPLGGGEKLPKVLNDYANGHMVVEYVRAIINEWYRFKLTKFRNIKRCDYFMFANKETQDFLMKVRVNNSLYFDNGLRLDELQIKQRGGKHIIKEDEYVVPETLIGKEELVNKEYIMNRKRVFLTAGRMAYRKGHLLLLDAIREIPLDMEFECRLVGDGPEYEHIKKLCNEDMILKKHVVLTGNIPYIDMKKEYEKADVFIMPSIRETTGTVLLEAMANAMPIITMNKFGGAVLLDDTCAWLYEGQNKESYIKNLASAMMECIELPCMITQKGEMARHRAEKYVWEEKNKYYQTIYQSLFNN